MNTTTADTRNPALDPDVGKPQKLNPKLLLRVLWSMLRRRWLLLGFAAVIALVAGALGSKPLTEKVWKATALLLYTPPKVPDEIGTIAKSVELANMSGFVTSRPVLTKVNDALGGTFPVPILEQSVTAETSRMTKTLFLAMQWGDQEECQKLLEQLVIEYPKYVAGVRQAIAQSLLDEVNSQVVKAQSRLDSTRARYRDFLRENNIVDFKQDLILKQTHLLSLETNIDTLRRDEQSMIGQIEMLDKQINSIKQEQAAEEEANREFEAAAESLADNRRRQGRLQELIEEERRVMEVKSQIDIVRREYERAQQLAEKRLIPQSQLEAVRSKLEVLIAKVTESKQIRNWQSELKDLDKTVVPKNKNSKKGSPIISQILFKKLETELKIAHGQQGVVELEREVETLNRQIATFQERRSELNALEDEITALGNQKLALEEKAGMLKELAGLGPVEFSVISPAETGGFPVSSNRKKMFVGIAFVVMLLAGTSVAAFDVLLCGIIPADAQVELIGLPVLERVGELVDDDEDSVLNYGEPVRSLALRFRQMIPNNGSVILLSSLSPSPRFSGFLVDLAECFALRDERILIVDTRLSEDGLGEFADLIEPSVIAEQDLDSGGEKTFLPGLSDWLTFRVNSICDVVYPTTIAGTDCILPGNSPIGEEFATLRMADLIQFTRTGYSLVLLVAPEADLKSELQILSAHADGIAFSFEPAESLNHGVAGTVSSLSTMGAPMVGAIQL